MRKVFHYAFESIISNIIQKESIIRILEPSVNNLCWSSKIHQVLFNVPASLLM